MQASRNHLARQESFSPGRDLFPKGRTVIIGMDGLSRSLALDLCSRGLWPHLEQLVHSSGCISIVSELPEISPVNWTSFFTARGPEEHGVYGFTSVNPGNYQLDLIDFSHVKAGVFWDEPGFAGKTCRIINLPCTYPAPALKGVLISGFVAPSLERAVYPGALYPILHEMGYRLEADTRLGLDSPRDLLEDLKVTISSRLKALDLLWPDLAWDMFIVVFTELDRLSHFLFEALEDQKNPLHEPSMELLQSLDAAAGEVLCRFEDLPGPKRLMLVSDHGFVPLRTEVDVNVLLRVEGFLRLDRKPENELDLSCMHESSLAFALDPGRIYIHDRERFARGRVDRVEKGAVLQKIRRSMLDLEHQGQKVMHRVYTAEEIYPDGIGLPPDLLCVPEPGFDLKAKFDRREIFGYFGRTGTHSPEDVIFYDSLGSRPGRVRDIMAGLSAVPGR